MSKFIANVALLCASYVVWVNLFTKGFGVPVVSWKWVLGMLSCHLCILMVHLILHHVEKDHD